MPFQKKTHRQLFRYDPHLGYRFVPNLTTRILGEQGGFFVRTNSAGFRSDAEFVEEKGDRPRILFFGDSNTAGDGMANEERFAELTADLLHAEAYNYGLSGSGADQQLLIYQQHAADVTCDAVVLGIMVENIRRIVVKYRQMYDPQNRKYSLVAKPRFRLDGEELALDSDTVPQQRVSPEDVDPEDVQWTAGDRKSFKQKSFDAVRDSRLFQTLEEKHESKTKQMRSFLIRHLHTPYPEYDDPSSESYRLMDAILKQFLKRIQENHNVPVVLMPIPPFHYFVDEVKPNYSAFFQRFQDPDNRVFVVDLLSRLKKIPYEKRWDLVFKEDRYHFSPLGNRIIGRFLAGEINSLGLLGSERVTITRPTLAPGKPLTPKRAKPTWILGVSAFYHDSAAAIIRDGEIVAAVQEERFTRKKNDRRFPRNAINYCLEEAGIHQDDLDAVIYYDNAYLTLERMLYTFASRYPDNRDQYLRSLPAWVRYKLRIPSLIRKEMKYHGPILHTIHHRSHAAAAFFPSPFKEAAILTVDGVGEWATATIAHGKGNKVKILKEMSFPNSIGLLYSAFTYFTGFKVNSGEYKMMGLAPYGQPKYVDAILEHLVDLKEDGSIELNQEYFGYLDGHTMAGEKFAELFDGPARDPETPITRREMDLARSIQDVTEMALQRMAQYAKDLTGAEYLCMAGGVALNCVANGHLLRSGLFKDIWIQPAAGDAGCALGAAFDAYHHYFNGRRSLRKDGLPKQLGSYWGPQFSMDEITGYLDSYNVKYRVVSNEDRPKILAQYLADGKVIGHFAGRTEFGPRALGARSIIGDPRNREMQVTLNLKIKYRESFRPFAPTVLEERISDYFEIDRPSPYMLLVAQVRKERQIPCVINDTEDMLEIVRRPRSDVSAITHVDYSARIQSVSQQAHPQYHAVIKAFEDITNYGVIVNTSFNVRGEPIVNTPHDAFSCFMNTEMDVLALENAIVLKEDMPDDNRIKGHIEKPDEVAKVDKEDPVVKRLDHLYESTFQRAVKAMTRAVPERIVEHPRKLESVWREYTFTDAPHSLFLIPPVLDTDTVDVEAGVIEMLKHWEEPEQGKGFYSFLRAMLLLGNQYPIEEEEAEKVSDVMYEMF